MDMAFLIDPGSMFTGPARVILSDATEVIKEENQQIKTSLLTVQILKFLDQFNNIAAVELVALAVALQLRMDDVAQAALEKIGGMN